MTTISFKVKEEEAREIRLAAKEAGLTLSEYLRRRAIQGDRGRPVSKVVCPHTGAEIFAPLAGEPPLTTRRVKALLTDFP